MNANELGIQVIMPTHSDAIREVADTCYDVWLKGQVSQVQKQ